MIKNTCSWLGIPLSIEKIEGPTQCLTLLGITLDTKVMQARLPEDKLGRLHNQVTVWLPRKKATKREILSLAGLLQHATKVVAPRRTFASRMYKAAARLKKLSHTMTFTTGFHSDLRWWHLFATRWKGINFFNNSTPDYFISTDASGAWGCGAVFGWQWMQLASSKEWVGTDIMVKELLPIVLSYVVWGHYYQAAMSNSSAITVVW